MADEGIKTIIPAETTVLPTQNKFGQIGNLIGSKIPTRQDYSTAKQHKKLELSAKPHPGNNTFYCCWAVFHEVTRVQSYSDAAMLLPNQAVVCL